jgi:regulator of sirC expression with transglutaminase-like and TPR domain
MERTVKLAPDYPEVWYDVAVIRLSNDDVDGALEALSKAIQLNPKLAAQAREDNDLEMLHGNSQYEALVKKSEK